MPAVVIVALLLLALPPSAPAAKKNPCAPQAELQVLARAGASRIVQPPGDLDAYACTPARPRGLRLAEGAFSEPCGSNSSRSVGVPRKGGAALAGRFALVAVNVVNDNCRNDDGFRVLRWDLVRGRRAVVAAGKGSYADGVRVNARGRRPGPSTGVLCAWRRWEKRPGCCLRAAPARGRPRPS